MTADCENVPRDSENVSKSNLNSTEQRFIVKDIKVTHQ